MKKTQTNYTLEEYATLEKESEDRLESFEGNVWSKAGASPKHGDIISNLITELKTKLRGRGCKVYGSNLRVTNVSVKTMEIVNQMPNE
ncbi:MAG TPA: Uma2 family endonuclease [Pyrinomonadaceae bacterium]|nr:Uma2 family endonuclease [Pyrinomonadaceae bacterium]